MWFSPELARIRCICKIAGNPGYIFAYNVFHLFKADRTFDQLTKSGVVAVAEIGIICHKISALQSDSHDVDTCGHEYFVHFFSYIDRFGL